MELLFDDLHFETVYSQFETLVSTPNFNNSIDSFKTLVETKKLFDSLDVNKNGSEKGTKTAIVLKSFACFEYVYSSHSEDFILDSDQNSFSSFRAQVCHQVYKNHLDEETKRINTVCLTKLRDLVLFSFLKNDYLSIKDFIVDDSANTYENFVSIVDRLLQFYLVARRFQNLFSYIFNQNDNYYPKVLLKSFYKLEKRVVPGSMSAFFVGELITFLKFKESPIFMFDLYEKIISVINLK